MLSYNILNGTLVLKDKILQKKSFCVENGVIKKIGVVIDDAETIDASGLIIIPGLIDLHSTDIESAIEPRQGCFIDVPIAFNETEKRCAYSGITTCFHSLSLRKSSNHSYPERIARTRDIITKIIDNIMERKQSIGLIKHKLHIRYDISSEDNEEYLYNLIQDGSVDRLSLHMPRQFDTPDFYKLDFDSILKKMPYFNRVQELVSLAKEKHIPIASHDDDCIEKVDFFIKYFSPSLSEFPKSIEIAKYLKSNNIQVMSGATNLLSGKSRVGGMSATTAARNSCLSIVCSDFYPPAILPSLFSLNKQTDMKLYDCVNMATFAPAKVMGLENIVGSIECNKSADLLCLDIRGQVPKICWTMVEGAIVQNTSNKLF